MGTLMNLFQSISEGPHWVDDKNLPAEDLAAKEVERKTWNSIISQIRGAFEIVSEIVHDGLEHAGFALEILPRPKSSKPTSKGTSRDADVEAKGQSVRPGELAFADHLDDRIKTFRERRSQMRAWATERGFSADEKISEVSHGESKPETPTVKDFAQLYILLFLEKMVSFSSAAPL
jgi:hypothetical protein